MGSLISLLITLLILGLIVWLIFWIIDMIPVIPATPKLIIKCIIGLICVLYLLGLLFGWASYPVHWYRGP